MVAEPIGVGEVPGHPGTYRNGKQASQQYRVFDVNGKSVAVTTTAITNVAEPVEYPCNQTADEKSQTIKAQYYKTSVANICCYSSTYGASGVAVKTDVENVGDCQTIEKAIPKLVDKLGYVPEKFNAYNVAEIKDKSPTLSTGSMVTSSYATTILTPSDKPVYEVKNGMITLKDKQYPIKLADGYYIIRKLSPEECERLQTMPTGYTDVKGVSKTQRYKALGNGWTAEVIIHILEGALKDVPRDEEIVVLSMYDGIATGRYCLDAMGFTNVKYYAYEIDKYAKQIAMHNYPDIIQCGDAFDVRRDDWSIDTLEN